MKTSPAFLVGIPDAPGIWQVGQMPGQREAHGGALFKAAERGSRPHATHARLEGRQTKAVGDELILQQHLLHKPDSTRNERREGLWAPRPRPSLGSRSFVLQWTGSCLATRSCPALTRAHLWCLGPVGGSASVSSTNLPPGRARPWRGSSPELGSEGGPKAGTQVFRCQLESGFPLPWLLHGTTA